MLKILLFTLLMTSSLLQANWNEYKSLFIAKDGRVIDRVNGDITHSESIGYALYFALKNNDIRTFNKVHRWYKNNLKSNDYGLIGWKWGKDNKDLSWHLLDSNNATDGDLWIAYDNLLMYEKTKNIEYKNEAMKMVASIKKNLILSLHGKLFLLPAEQGFVQENFIEINLSYYLFFIFDKFKEYDNDSVWQQLKSDGIALLKEAVFTPLKLPADWIKVNKMNLKIELGKEGMFGYDALRIPYNILKSDIKDKRELLQPFIRYVESMKKAHTVFGVTDLKNGNINLYNYSYAHLSIYDMLDRYFNNTESFQKQIEQLKRLSKNDYYSYSIYLFTTFN